MAETTTYLARLVDLVENRGSTSSSDTDAGVYVYPCIPCGPPDPDLYRLVDIVLEPDPVQRILQPYVPVYATVSPCGKEWESAEDYVEYDMGFGHTRVISRELRARITGPGALGCAGEDCYFFNLDFDSGENGWVANVPFASGTMTVLVYGTFDGFNEFWWYEATGCPTENAFPVGADVLCDQPLRLLSEFALLGPPVPGACCEYSGTIELMVWALIPPYYLTRFVDMVRDDRSSGSGIGENVPVFLSAECCDLPCDPIARCCPGINSGTTVIVMTFEVASVTCNGGGDCGILGTGQTSPWDWIVTVACENESGIQTNTAGVQLACNAAVPEGAQNYVINVTDSLGSHVYSPSSGSCGPLVLEFPAAVTLDVTLPDSSVCTVVLDLVITV